MQKGKTMVLISFGLTGLRIQKRHEFGHESMPKLLQIDLLFLTVFIFGKKGQFFKFMRDYFTNAGVEKLPQYRQQVKKIKSKARAQERAWSQQRIKRLENDVKSWKDRYSKLQDATTELKALGYAVRRIKNINLGKLDDL